MLVEAYGTPPASHSVATARRLCRMPGMRHALRAAVGSLSKSKSSVSVVVIVAPLGILKCFASSIPVPGLAGSDV